MSCRCGALDCPRCYPGQIEHDGRDRYCTCQDCVEARYEAADYELDRLKDAELDRSDWEMEVRADDLRP